MVTVPTAARMLVSVILVAAEHPVILMAATLMLVNNGALLDRGVAGLASVVLESVVALLAVVVMLAVVGMGRRGAGRMASPIVVHRVTSRVV
jgi:hypothetical protein